MAYKARRRGNIRWLAPLALLMSAYACGSSDEAVDRGGAAGGSSCSADGDCASGACTSGTCATSPGDECSTNAECASGVCQNGACTGTTGTGGSSGNNDGGPPGSACTANDQCASGVCDNGTCTGTTGTGGTTTGSGGSSTGTGGTSTSVGGTTGTGGSGGLGGTGTGGNPGAHFDGSGSGYRPLTTGCGPDTADQCTGECEQTGGVDSTVIRPPATLCFSASNDPTPEDPALVIEQVIETINGVTYIHIRITFDPYYTDNSYGAGACCGWGKMRGHTFNDDLTKSDHTELLLTDGNGNTIMNFKLDYVSADPTQPCGYGSLGVSGGDGIVISGDASAIVESTTSIERNLNGCGYCTSEACAPSGDCTIDSPTTDANFTPNPLTPNWDYRNVYEIWLLADAFGSAGFGQAYVTYVHASPSKISADMLLTPSPCPSEYDSPYCPPSVTQEGGNCFGTGGSGGDGGTVCAVNYQLYITTEGAAICTPIPYANYPDHAACPTGYVLDIASEGQYCLPA